MQKVYVRKGYAEGVWIDERGEKPIVMGIKHSLYSMAGKYRGTHVIN